MGRGAWRATVHRVENSRLSMHARMNPLPTSNTPLLTWPFQGRATVGETQDDLDPSP